MNPADGPVGNNVVISQSVAILLYLAGNHPQSSLIPTLGSTARGCCYQLLFFVAEVLQPSYHMFYYPERHTTKDDAASHQTVQSKSIAWIDDIWQRHDGAIGEGTYFG
jgi:glutathione S-transferase